MTLKSAYRLVAALALVICCAAAVLAQISTAKVTGGIVEGVVKDGIASFKGIPFAAPPVGELRWKPPQPVIPWKGIKKTDGFAPAPIQDLSSEFSKASSLKVSEDCLYLNVWTGAKKAVEKRPVMVWIYGGSFAAGTTSAPFYDGTYLAQKGVVLVSVAYRVGPMGFLAHPELSKESGKGSGAYGIQDQIAGLKWVKENIAQFGGDPSKVTIFGESAGGLAVSMLTVSPMAKGLFQRAIIESGAAPTPISLKEGEEKGKTYLEKLGANDIKAARALSVEVFQKDAAGWRSFKPVVDGETIMANQYEFLKAGKFNDLPILVGTNSRDGEGFATRWPGLEKDITGAVFESVIPGILTSEGLPELRETVLKLYPHATDAEATKSANYVLADLVFNWQAWAWASLQSNNGKNKAFFYYFDHRTPSSPEGAKHGAEIPYVFGNLDLLTDHFPRLGELLSVANRPEDKAISELMASYWVNFAKKGDPNGPGLPVWPALDRKKQVTMIFGEVPSVGQHPNLDRIKIFDVYYAKVREKTKVAK